MTRRHENFTIKFVIFVTCKLQLSGVIFDSRSSSGGAVVALLRACGSGGMAVGSAVGQRRSSSFQTCLSSSWSKELGTHQAANCGDADDASVAVVADLFSNKAVDKSSKPAAAACLAVCLADAVFTPNQLLFIIIDFYDYWCAAAAHRAVPRYAWWSVAAAASKASCVELILHQCNKVTHL